MVATVTVARFISSLLISLPLTGILINSSPVQAQNQPPVAPDSSQATDLADPNNPRNQLQDQNLLSMTGGKKLMDESEKSINSQDYATAAKKLQQARIIFNQLSNFYQQLSSSFTGIDNRVVESVRKKALATALMRDDATYKLALVHRSLNQPELAVPLLIQVIRSQNPSRELGTKAYKQLFEIGFVDTPYQKDTATSSEKK